jgi:hypothetical protein
MIKVGKKVGDFIYIHKSALKALTEYKQDFVKEAEKALPEGFTYEVLKIGTESVSFISAPNFDTEDEPALSASVKVANGEASTIKKESATNPTIYHGKHFFVLPDYKGFDVEAAEA